MSDKLYVSALSFECNTLSEAGEALQGYLDLGINPILTNTDILMSAADYAKTLTIPTEYIDVLSIYDPEGHEIRGWYVEMELRTDGVIQGKLIGRGVGSLRFVKSQGVDTKFLLSGGIATYERCRGMIQRMSKRLGIIL
jgi:hypothetical protein